jgi:hypothetical protein
MSALPHFSDIDLLRYCKRIIDLDFRDNGLYSRLWCGRAEAELLEDFRFSYGSELPWSYAVNACHKRMRPSQSS